MLNIWKLHGLIETEKKYVVLTEIVGMFVIVVIKRRRNHLNIYKKFSIRKPNSFKRRSYDLSSPNLLFTIFQSAKQTLRQLVLSSI